MVFVDFLAKVKGLRIVYESPKSFSDAVACVFKPNGSHNRCCISEWEQQAGVCFGCGLLVTKCGGVVLH